MSARFERKSWVALLLCLCFALSARAEEPRKFRTNLRVELPLLAVGWLGYVVTEGLKTTVAPSECRLCGTNALDDHVRDAWRWSNTLAAKRLSNVLFVGIVPVAAFGGAALIASSSHRTGVVFTDLLIVAESFVLTADITNATKFAVARERPYAHANRVEHGPRAFGKEDNLSFFSGHASFTFALATAAGMTASLRGYRLAPLVWAIGMPLAALTGYARIAADKHYFTDVMTGALVGSAVGALVPWLHARRERSSVPAISMSGSALTLTWMR